MTRLRSLKLPPALARRLYWAEQALRGRGSVRERLQWLEQTQWWTPERLRELQLEKLRATLVHAYATVPYYRRVMDEHAFRPHELTDVRDLAALPLLSRSRLLANQSELLSETADTKTLQRNFSSGSTGQRAEFVQDLDFRLWMRAHQLRTYGWCGGWRIGEPFLLLWGSEVYWSLRGYVDRIENAISNRREFNTFRLAPELVARFADEIARFRPVLISTYANAINLIAAEVEARGTHVDGLRCIQGTSEPLPPAMRARVASAFGCEVYDKYGMRETNIVSHESPRHEDMLVQVENVVVEHLTDDGRPCAPGETGRLVLTTLNNRSMPLIRYETSDLAAPLEGTCSSGMGLPRMTSVAGREQDLIVTPNGDRIDAYFFSYLLMRMPEVQWFQVIQQTPEELNLRVYAPRGLSHGTHEAICERIQHHTGFPFKLDIETLADMPESNTGKFRLCVSELGGAAQTGTRC